MQFYFFLGGGSARNPTFVCAPFSSLHHTTKTVVCINMFTQNNFTTTESNLHMKYAHDSLPKQQSHPTHHSVLYPLSVFFVLQHPSHALSDLFNTKFSTNPNPPDLLSSPYTKPPTRGNRQSILEYQLPNHPKPSILSDKTQNIDHLSMDNTVELVVSHASESRVVVRTSSRPKFYPSFSPSRSPFPITRPPVLISQPSTQSFTQTHRPTPSLGPIHNQTHRTPLLPAHQSPNLKPHPLTHHIITETFPVNHTHTHTHTYTHTQPIAQAP